MFRPLSAILRSQKMYNEEKLYGIKSLVAVHILYFLMRYDCHAVYRY